MRNVGIVGGKVVESMNDDKDNDQQGHTDEPKIQLDKNNIA